MIWRDLFHIISLFHSLAFISLQWPIFYTMHIMQFALILVKYCSEIKVILSASWKGSLAELLLTIGPGLVIKFRTKWCVSLLTRAQVKIWRVGTLFNSNIETRKLLEKKFAGGQVFKIIVCIHLPPVVHSGFSYDPVPYRIYHCCL